MSSILAKHFALPTFKNILFLYAHIDSYGSKKLLQFTSSSMTIFSMFKAIALLFGIFGYVNIFDHRSSKVPFATDVIKGDYPARSSSMFVKSIKEIPYNILVMQISVTSTFLISEARHHLGSVDIT